MNDNKLLLFNIIKYIKTKICMYNLRRTRTQWFHYAHTHTQTHTHTHKYIYILLIIKFYSDIIQNNLITE